VEVKSVLGGRIGPLSLELNALLVGSPSAGRRGFSVAGAAERRPGAVAGASMATGAILFRDCSAEAEGKTAKLDVNFMDRIAGKPYLNYNSIQSVADKHHQTSHHYRKIAAKVQTTIAAPGRPLGVPSRLRLLAIDVPELKGQAFSDVTVCKPPSEIFKTTDPTFSDGVAKSKKMDTSLLDRKIAVQKSLARQSPKRSATPRIGVEILEASVASLNPSNIRRTYTSLSGRKSRMYDRAVKFDSSLSRDDEGLADADEVEEQSKDFDQIQAAEEHDLIRDKNYERDAPWNQYAWLEEMSLRIQGRVRFGQPCERARFLSQWLFGAVYCQTVPPESSQQSWCRWLFPMMWSDSRDGVDGEQGECPLYGQENKSSWSSWSLPWRTAKTLNRASNKP
ncbi:hypothetical protein THAOC_17293, partial [Thalassiosira oceanica]